jgi:hypothetical protein
LKAIDAAGAATETAAANQVRQRLEQMGGAGGGDRQTQLQQHGDTARAVIKGANDAAKQREDQLWRAVDPRGDLTVGTDRLRNGAAQIREGMAQNDKPMSGVAGHSGDLRDRQGMASLSLCRNHRLLSRERGAAG